MTKIFFRSGNIIAIVVLAICGLLVLGGAIYYFLVYAPGQQGSPIPVDTVQQETVDDLESKVKGVGTSDPVPADELDPVKDTIGL